MHVVSEDAAVPRTELGVTFLKTDGVNRWRVSLSEQQTVVIQGIIGKAIEQVVDG